MATTSDEGVVCNRKRKHEQHDGCSRPNIIPLDVEKDVVTIGRLKDATVHLQCSHIPSMISRKHASIVHNRLKRKWLIKDHKVIRGNLCRPNYHLKSHNLCTYAYDRVVTEYI